MYVVLVHNDPITQREFVVEVLTVIFNKTVDQAIKIMTTAHTMGAGTAGVYTQEIAETKAAAATTYCRSRRQVLQFSFEEQ